MHSGRDRPRIVMVGAFPSPVHGMALVNVAMRSALEQHGLAPLVIDLAAPSLARSVWTRAARLVRVLRGLLRLATLRRGRGGSLYMSVSGGFGQVYETVFAGLARLHGLRVFLHHHSFAYINEPRRITSWLFRVAGADSVHIVLSPDMARRLSATYGLRPAVVLSNAVMIAPLPDIGARIRSGLRTMGFLSNISADKGIFEFLELFASLRRDGCPLHARLAGRFQDASIQREVGARLHALPELEYVGPVFGDAKEAFFDAIDVLIFPTRYANEAEPLTVHEAMMRGIPVIAYGRGAIPEILGADCGCVVHPSEPFVPAAQMQIRAWIDDAAMLTSASKASVSRFAKIRERNQLHWQTLIGDLSG